MRKILVVGLIILGTILSHASYTVGYARWGKEYWIASSQYRSGGYFTYRFVYDTYEACMDYIGDGETGRCILNPLYK